MARNPSAKNNVKTEDADIRRENEELREKVRELEETLEAIRSGEVDAIVVANGEDRKVYTLEGADHPYRVLVENIREGAMTISRTGTILYTNSRFAGMVKMHPEKIAGTSLLDYVCPEYRAQVELALQEIMKRSCRSRVRILQGKKGSLPVLISMNSLSAGEDTKISVVITDRRKDEYRIVLQARMLDAVGDAVIAADTHNKIVYWNDAAAKTYGWEPKEAIGRNLIDTVVPEISKKEARDIAERIAKGETWTGEHVVRHRDGHEFPVYTNNAPFFDEDGKLIAIIGVSHDITERKRAVEEQRQKHEDLQAAYEEIASTQEELRRNVEELSLREQELVKSEANLKDALAEKEILLSEIHHRVKNNLTAFISLLSLDGSYEDTEGGRSLRKDLQNRARSMALIHETLYRTGKFSNVDMETYLTTLVSQTAGTYADNTKIQAIVDVHDVALDLARATTAGLIINELVTNSFKYAFPPGFDCMAVRGEPCAIRISLTSDDRTYVLTVTDNGRGLPEGFDPLTTKSLGLKLVNFLARHQLRAEIGVRSERGTEFIFRMKKTEEYA